VQILNESADLSVGLEHQSHGPAGVLVPVALAGGDEQALGLAEADQELCFGCGLCEEVCLQVFWIEGDVARVKVEAVPPESEQACRQAKEECPTEAISIKA